jgi:hypothetical protein
MNVIRDLWHIVADGFVSYKNVKFNDATKTGVSLAPRDPPRARGVRRRSTPQDDVSGPQP